MITKIIIRKLEIHKKYFLSKKNNKLQSRESSEKKTEKKITDVKSMLKIKRWWSKVPMT